MAHFRRPLISLLAVASVSTTLGACIRDQKAPDCYRNDCSLPRPDEAGATDLTIDCSDIPIAAVDAPFSYIPTVTGGSGEMGAWEAENLPTGLSINAANGTIEGVPTEQGSFELTLSVSDDKVDTRVESMCSLTVNEALSVPELAQASKHCIDIRVDELNDFLVGGTDQPITCSEPMRSSEPGPDDPMPDSCPMRDGNGVKPKGVSLDGDACEYSISNLGSADDPDFFHGTYAWMVEVSQGDHSIWVPFCVSSEESDMPFHSLEVRQDGMETGFRQPGFMTFDADSEPSFGNAASAESSALDPEFRITHDCPDTACARYGFEYLVSCSPFDFPGGDSTRGMINDEALKEDRDDGMGGTIEQAIGFRHGLSARGPVPDSKFHKRPWIVNFRSWYCTGDASDDDACDESASSDVFRAGAQTRMTWSVIAFPEGTADSGGDETSGGETGDDSEGESGGDTSSSGTDSGDTGSETDTDAGDTGSESGSESGTETGTTG